MLVTLNEILAIAKERNCAVGAFNTPNLECVTAVLNAAEKLNVPVILSHAELHESVAPLAVIGPVMVQAAKNAKVPVCVHLDHCETLGYMAEALKLGFTGVMYDGSVLPYEENVANTKIAVAMAREYGANVEAEIGQLASREGGTEENAGGPVYTDPDLAVKFCQETGIDALACAFGTVHGMYLREPKLDFDRLAKINELVSVPLVMHGGSGVSVEDYRRVISLGISKINYYTYMSKAGAEAITGKTFTQYHDIVKAATEAMRVDVANAIRVFSGL